MFEHNNRLFQKYQNKSVDRNPKPISLGSRITTHRIPAPIKTISNFEMKRDRNLWTNRSQDNKNRRLIIMKQIVAGNLSSSGKKTFYATPKHQKRQLSMSMRMGNSCDLQATSFWNGKTNKFTDSFHNNMYRDTRINSIKRKIKIDSIRKVNLAIKEKQKEEVFNEMKRKNMIAKFFKNKFDVRANFEDLRKFNHGQLERKLLNKGLYKKKMKAAIRIQTQFR